MTIGVDGKVSGNASREFLIHFIIKGCAALLGSGCLWESKMIRLASIWNLPQERQGLYQPLDPEMEQLPHPSRNLTVSRVVIMVRPLSNDISSAQKKRERRFCWWKWCFVRNLVSKSRLEDDSQDLYRVGGVTCQLMIDELMFGTDNCGSLGGASYYKHLVFHAQLSQECGGQSFAISASWNSGKHVRASGWNLFYEHVWIHGYCQSDGEELLGRWLQQR